MKGAVAVTVIMAMTRNLLAAAGQAVAGGVSQRTVSGTFRRVFCIRTLTITRGRQHLVLSSQTLDGRLPSRL